MCGVMCFTPGHIASPNHLESLSIPKSAGKYALVEWHDYAAGPNPSPSSKKFWSSNGTVTQRKLFTNIVQMAVQWSNKSGMLMWFGTWMSGDYNHGNHFTIPQQVAFSEFICRVLKGAGIPWAINTFPIFFDTATDTPKHDLLPVWETMEEC